MYLKQLETERKEKEILPNFYFHFGNEKPG